MAVPRGSALEAIRARRRGHTGRRLLPAHVLIVRRLMLMTLGAIPGRPVIAAPVAILTLGAGSEGALTRDLVASVTQVAASADAAEPIGCVILPMVLAPVFVPQLLLSALLVLLSDRPAFHLLAGFECLPLRLLLPQFLILGRPLFILLLLVLDQLLEHVGLLELVGGDLLLGGQMAQTRVPVIVLLMTRLGGSTRSAVVGLAATCGLLPLHRGLLTRPVIH